MKRECTEAENRIIKECTEDIIACPEVYTAVSKRSFVSISVWTAASLVLSSVAALKLSTSLETWIRVILVIGVLAGVELLGVIWCICRKKKVQIKKFSGDKFWVNGGTVINMGYSKAETYLVYAEDDLMDAKGNPLCIMLPASYCTDIGYGKRIILVYSDNGDYFPLRVTEHTRDFIPERPPEYFSKVNWNEAARIPHPEAMALDQVNTKMSESEKTEFVKRCNSFKNIRVMNGIGIVLTGVLVLLLLVLLFSSLVECGIITGLSATVIFVVPAAAVWIFLVYILAKVLLSGRTRGWGKIQYKKKVMFCALNTEAAENSVYKKFISVYEYIDGEVELMSYPVNCNVFLPKNMTYGKMIYRYSKDAKSNVMGLNFFGLPQ